MKSLTGLGLLLLLSCTGCTQGTDYMKFNEAFVSEFSINNDFDLNQLKFNEVETVVLGNSEGDGIKLAFYNCVGWENDPGDFRKVVLYKGSTKLFELINMGGWVKLNEKWGESVNNLFFFDSGNSLLGFVGYAYASDPGFLTLLSINNSKVQVVFNNPFEVKELSSEEALTFHGAYKEKNATIQVENNQLTIAVE